MFPTAGTTRSTMCSGWLLLIVGRFLWGEPARKLLGFRPARRLFPPRRNRLCWTCRLRGLRDAALAAAGDFMSIVIATRGELVNRHSFEFAELIANYFEEVLHSLSRDFVRHHPGRRATQQQSQWRQQQSTNMRQG